MGFEPTDNNKPTNQIETKFEGGGVDLESDGLAAASPVMAPRRPRYDRPQAVRAHAVPAGAGPAAMQPGGPAPAGQRRPQVSPHLRRPIMSSASEFGYLFSDSEPMDNPMGEAYSRSLDGLAYDGRQQSESQYADLFSGTPQSMVRRPENRMSAAPMHQHPAAAPASGPSRRPQFSRRNRQSASIAAYNAANSVPAAELSARAEEEERAAAAQPQPAAVKVQPVPVQQTPVQEPPVQQYDSYPAEPGYAVPYRRGAVRRNPYAYYPEEQQYYDPYAAAYSAPPAYPPSYGQYPGYNPYGQYPGYPPYAQYPGYPPYGQYPGYNPYGQYPAYPPGYGYPVQPAAVPYGAPYDDPYAVPYDEYAAGYYAAVPVEAEQMLPAEPPAAAAPAPAPAPEPAPAPAAMPVPVAIPEVEQTASAAAEKTADKPAASEKPTAAAESAAPAPSPSGSRFKSRSSDPDRLARREAAPTRESVRRDMGDDSPRRTFSDAMTADSPSRPQKTASPTDGFFAEPKDSSSTDSSSRRSFSDNRPTDDFFERRPERNESDSPRRTFTEEKADTAAARKSGENSSGDRFERRPARSESDPPRRTFTEEKADPFAARKSGNSLPDEFFDLKPDRSVRAASPDDAEISFGSFGPGSDSFDKTESFGGSSGESSGGSPRFNRRSGS